jgi:ankyrin repeat protein
LSSLLTKSINFNPTTIVVEQSTYLIKISSKSQMNFQGHIELAQLLVEAGSDVNVQTMEGATALTLASAFGNPDIAQLLIEAGAKE